ncbi:MAG: fasciclin domain-containing protein [Erythrobacter sp.]|nr:fasciclin domain-containing protein [Erythrobacter sp.]NCQ62877.1 fasciclin domain-containing protein [Alphaproteobacteria bacterium]
MFAKKTYAALTLAASAALIGGCASYGMDDGAMASADTTVMVGGAPMYPTRNIVENAVNSADHTTLVAAVKAAGLVDTLSGPGPFTVFAPTNAAFDKLPAGTVDTLLKPANKPMLTKILTYHVVPGRVSAEDLMMKIRQGGGMAKLTTVEGGTLTAKMMNGNVVLVDEKGGMATVTQADVFQSNGVIHVTDTVSMPS